MIAANHVRTSTGAVRVRPVALPVEHGGWGLLFEPIVLGLVLVPSPGGLCLAVAAVACFLARHPFKLAVSDRRRSRRLSRTVLAERFVLLYVGIAVLSLAAAIKTAHAGFLLTLLLAAPLSVVQLAYDSMGRSRALIAELAGSISVGAVAAAIALAGGWPRPAAFGLWAIMATRVVPTILYLRARLRLSHRKPASPRLVIVAHLMAIMVVIGLARAGVVPFLAVAGIVILLMRAVIGFSRPGKLATAKKLGLWELGFGAMIVFAVVLGHAIGR